MDKNRALQKLLNGTATEEEIDLLKQALTNGEISISGNVHHSVLIIGSENKVELTTEALSILRSDATNNYREKPYPREIISEINNLPLIQQDSVRKHYVGLRVRWRATIFSLQVNENDIVHLSMRDRGSYPWIYCELPLNNYPELKTVREGHELWLEGEISEVGGNQIYLKKCRITID